MPCDALVTSLDLVMARWVFAASPPQFVPLPLTIGFQTMHLPIPMMEMGNVDRTVAVHNPADACDEVCFLDPVFLSSDVAALNVPTCHLFLPHEPSCNNYVFVSHENNPNSTCVFLSPNYKAHGRVAVDVGPDGLRVTFDNGLVLSSPWAVPMEDGSTALMAIGVYYYAAGLRVCIEDS